MAAGALVLASTKGGGPEIIEDGRNGFLVEPKDPARLADKIAEILNLPTEQKNWIRACAQEDARKRFDCSVVGPRFVEFLDLTVNDFYSKRQ